jgi:aspartyl/asparaginyl-tRNA synthetase
MNPKHYHYVVNKLRQYFNEQGLIECYLNDNPSILAACEDVANLHTYNWGGTSFAHMQTSQMLLEKLCLEEGKDFKGYYNMCNSFRLEKNPVKNRHAEKGQFALLECEGPWDQRGMIQFQKGMLRSLGIHPWQGDDFPEITYKEACLKYGVHEIGHEEEIKLCHDLNSPVVFLKDFTYNSFPFWNMKKQGDVALKVDILIGNVQPMEVVGSAERSCNKEEMRECFHTISNGQYAQFLYNEFGKERVEKELEEYLSHNFIQRSGMGIGMNRLVYACETLGLFDHLDQ